jgi:hypothetical protein
MKHAQDVAVQTGDARSSNMLDYFAVGDGSCNIKEDTKGSPKCVPVREVQAAWQFGVKAKMKSRNEHLDPDPSL